MHQRQNTKHSTTGTTQDTHIFFTHRANWIRLLAPGHMYWQFSILAAHNIVLQDTLPTRNKEAKTAATKLFNDYILRFGTANKILHDQGREFENKLFIHLSKLCNIKRLRTTLYHPQCNGQN